MDLRETKGKQIALTKQIRKVDDGFIVKSQNSNRYYFVDENGKCNCPDCEINGAKKCKHSYAVNYFLTVVKTDLNGAIQTQKIRLTYPQAWHAYNQAQNNEVKQFESLLKDLLETVEEPARDGAGRPSLSLRESLFCSIKKVYSQMSSRRAKGLFDEAKEKMLIEKSPYFNCVSALLNKEETTALLEGLITLSALPLKSVESSFAVDSSGFRTTKFTEYCKDKHGIEKHHEYLKAHILCGTKTNIVCSAKVTNENGADITQFAPLVQNTNENGFDIKELSADKAYNSANNYNMVREVGAVPYIPYKSNTVANSHSGNKAKFWRRMYHYFQANQEEFSEHYHKRSNVETTFFMIKSKLGDCLKSKNFIAQKNELLCKILAHNLIVLITEIYELGISAQFAPFKEKEVIENLHVNSENCMLIKPF